MKKLLLWAACFLLVMTTVKANDLSVVVVDSIKVADTIAAAGSLDTFYTQETRLQDFNRFQFFWTLLADGNNTEINLTADSFLIKFQHSFDRSNWRTWVLGALGAKSSGTWGAINIPVADSIIGNYGRGMIVHMDTTEADSPDSLDFVRSLKFNLWIAPKK